jgi:uncharacterized protein (TIGR03067 family)
MAVMVGLTISGDSLGVADKPDKVRRKDPVKELLKSIQGTWKLVSFTRDGEVVVEEVVLVGITCTFIISGNEVTTKVGEEILHKATLSVGQKGKLITLDQEYTWGDAKGLRSKGILQIKGDTLTFCFSPLGEKRPANFSSRKGTGNTLYVLRRVK